MVPETLVYILKQSRMGRMSNRLIAKILLPDVHSSKNRINRFRGQALIQTRVPTTTPTTPLSKFRHPLEGLYGPTIH